MSASKFLPNLMLLAIVSIALPLGAQQPEVANPFGDVPQGGATPFGAAAPAAPAAAALDPTQDAAAAEEEPETDPAVLAVQRRDPSSPQDLVWAAETMLNLGRPELAKAYLQQLVESEPAEPVLADLHQRFGSPLFLRFLRRAELAPHGQQLAGRVLEAAQQAAHDPQRLAQLAQQLTSQDPLQRHTALVDLRQVGAAAVPPILEALRQSAEDEQRAALSSALSRLGPPAGPPLIIAARSADDVVRLAAIEALGQIGYQEAAVHLIRPLLDERLSAEVRQRAADALERLVGAVPTRSEAQQYLTHQVDRLLEQSAAAVRNEQDDARVVWQWDEAKQLPEAGPFRPSTALMITAAQLSADLYRLFPEEPRHAALYLLARLQLEKLVHGLDEPLPRAGSSAFAAASAAGPETVERVLVWALEMNFVPGAVGALEVLGEIGSPALLHAPHGQPRPLAAALDHPAQRVQMAAARAILEIDPQQPFAGSSRLPEVLGYFAAANAAPRVLVVHPSLSEAQSLAGMFNGLGYESEGFSSGAALFRQATARAETALLVVSQGITAPDAHHLVQMLRQDSRTARLPVALLADVEDPQWRRVDEQDERLALWVPPVSQQHLAMQIATLQEDAAWRGLSAGRRLAYAASALEGFAHWAARPDRYSFYDLVKEQDAIEQALYVPQLNRLAARILGLLGTPKAQQALVEFASQPVHAAEARQAAAEAFASAVQQHGILLTAAQIQRQYDRYGAMAPQDPAEPVLGLLLDAMEAAAKQ